MQEGGKVECPELLLSLIIHRLRVFLWQGALTIGTPKHTLCARPRKDIGVVLLRSPYGRYEYRYIVDGEWYTDPSTPRVPNEYGSENSVIEVKKEGN